MCKEYSFFPVLPRNPVKERISAQGPDFLGSGEGNASAENVHEAVYAFTRRLAPGPVLFKEAAPRARNAPPRAPLQEPEPQLVCVVSEVVVVTGAGTVVCCVVVVLVWSGVLAQADNDTMAAATRHGMISFFTGMLVVLIFTFRRAHGYIISGR
jgi:hypothetical protein